MLQLRAGRQYLPVVLLSLGVFPWLAGSPCLAQPFVPPTTQLLRPLPQATIIFGGTDTRTRVTDTTVFPYSTVGMVQASFGATILQGTGTMIGTKTVLTAAHVVYDASLGGFADSIDFIPALDGNLEPFGSTAVTVHVVPPAWINGDETADIAILVLNTSPGPGTGIMQLAQATASFVTGQALLSSGYPADLDNNFQYLAPGPGVGLDGDFLLEQIDTEPGQSGSPIWYDDPATGQPYMIAVLKGTRQLTSSLGSVTVQGIGVVITPEFAALINDTLSANGDTPQAIPTTPSTPITPAPPVIPTAARCGTCGAGTGQAIAICTLGWGVCFFSRRRRSL